MPLLDKCEQAGLAVATGGALGYRAAILLQFEQGGLLNSCRCRQLLATPLQKLAPDKPFAVDVDEFRADHSLLLPFGVQRSAALHPCPSARPGGSKGKGGGRVRGITHPPGRL